MPRRARSATTSPHGLGGLTRGLHRISKPVIAAVNGWALAGGLETALACDIRIASERAMFGSFEARRGYHHGDGGIVRLVNTCGAGIALEMLLDRRSRSTPSARFSCNLVSRVVPHERLIAEAELTARQILRNTQIAVRSAKETILDVIGRPLDDQLRIEALNALRLRRPRRRPCACCGASTTRSTPAGPGAPDAAVARSVPAARPDGAPASGAALKQPSQQRGGAAHRSRWQPPGQVGSALPRPSRAPARAPPVGAARARLGTGLRHEHVPGPGGEEVRHVEARGPPQHARDPLPRAAAPGSARPRPDSAPRPRGPAPPPV